ncbi:hypothetical protein, conserved [Plasmodium gonderi]|uniref:MerC domain-containing protein n=1 Tax=Plasmodium gonderi TaxID=77519 RepID=A0A1Y1JI61_PLAGO|nr:hypothetical protein, conserved [Plasmodium gonderi]GAW81318.1 hypothetical protein, conserved [Plasmodium gonderi]
MKNRLKRIYIYIKSNLNNISSIASIICLIDCVLIPLITVVISIFNVVNSSGNGHAIEDHSEHSHPDGWHEIVEKVALYIMTPIISMTTIYNFVQLRNVPLLLFTLVGLAMFVLSHAHINFNNSSVNNLFKKMHIPMAILAAIFLISSNYRAHELLKAKNLHRCCKHKKVTNHMDEQTCEDHHEHYDLEMNGHDFVMHDHVRKFENFYNIGYTQNSDHELVSFL